MAYTQKGFSMHSGTSRHASALKAHAKSNKPEMSQNPTHSGLNDGNNDFKSDKDFYDKAMDAPSKFLKESPVKQTTAPVHPDADKPYIKPNLTKKAENEAPKLTKKQMAQNKQDDKVTERQRGAHFKKELEAAKNTGEDSTNKQKANNKLELKKQKEIDKQLKNKEEIKLAGMSKDERKKHIADQKANNTEEGKGKNLFGKMGDGIKKIANKINEHGKKVGKDGNSGWDHLLHAMNEPISLTASGIKPPVSGRKTKEKNKEYDSNDPQNKLEEPQKQNDVLGANSGSKSSSKTSNEAQIEFDNARIEEEGNKVTGKMAGKFPNTYGKPDIKNDPIYIKYLESKTKK
jgi:hypothetical protein